MPNRSRRAPDRGAAEGSEAVTAQGSRRRKQLSRRERAAAEYQSRQAGLKRARTIVGFSGVIPLLGSFACDAGLTIMCVPFSWYLWMWAAIFGAFLGLTIRLIRERRRFEEQTRAG